MTKTYTVDVQKDEQTEDLFIELPSKLMENLGWKTGDDVKWEETDDGGARGDITLHPKLLDVEGFFRYAQRNGTNDDRTYPY